MLPAKLAPPRLPEGIAVVLVVDKSSSMEGKKMQLARQSALGVVENLRAIDKVGVLAFDNSFEWAVPLQRNEFPAATKKLISGIIADGGTQIAPALHEAYRLIKPQQTVYKHVLLLTDGISEEGDSIALAREAAMNAITISTIGLGQDVNRSYLERVANSAEGKSYFLLDISALEQIVLRDVMEHTGSSVTEKEFTPIADRSYEFSPILTSPSRGRCSAGSSSKPSRRRIRFFGSTTKIRCWCAGNTGWGARSSLLPTPKTAGPQTGSPGMDSTSSGQT